MRKNERCLGGEKNVLKNQIPFRESEHIKV